MQTVCNQTQLEFQGLGARRVVADFDGGLITSDAGALLLREVALRRNLFGKFAACFTDGRDGRRVEHTVEELVAQRAIGIALGYEDLNDHERLRHDPLLAVAAGKLDPSGDGRRRGRDKGRACAGKSTLNRLELAPASRAADKRYKKITWSREKIESFFVETFVDSYDKAPQEIVLDLDATDDPIHGHQQGRFFHGYYDSYCYLPLYIFCGDFLLCARLRPSNIDASAGCVKQLARIVSQIRARWPQVRIVIRADSGFCREGVMTWCEKNAVDFILGLARNERLEKQLAPAMARAKAASALSGRAERQWEDFEWQTRKSWSRARRVVGKAEWLVGDKANARFIVTSLGCGRHDARSLYEDIYCARGEMENRIKEQQLDMFAGRTSAATMRANQMRLHLSSLAYVLVNELRRTGLAGTPMQEATCATIRTRLLKIGGQVRLSVRRVLVRLSSAWPLRELFARILANLSAAPAPAG